MQHCDHVVSTVACVYCEPALNAFQYGVHLTTGLCIYCHENNRAKIKINKQTKARKTHVYT